MVDGTPRKWMTEIHKMPKYCSKWIRHGGAMKSKKWLSHFSKNDRVTVAKWLSTVAHDEI
jgi:hypothetical protein